MQGPSRPDILIVVLDCVRAESLGPWGLKGANPPNLRRLIERGTVFERCLAPSSWSMPSHASLFTGMSPWNHGAYGGADRRLAGRTVFEELTGLGYHTLSLSANPFIAPKTGLTRGFGSAFWGDWAAHYLRFLATNRPVHGFVPEPSAPGSTIRLSGRARRIAIALADSAQTLTPHWWRLTHLVSVRFDDGRNASTQFSAPWIEPTLEAWLQSLPPSEPACCFINLMDAHEPYLTPSRTAEPPGARDEASFLVDGRDRWHENLALDATRLEELKRRYLGAIGTLDGRIGRIFSTFGASRQLESTFVVLTSDHGQGFGENGHVFHEYDSGDETLRIPLLVGFPGGNYGGRRSNSWTSLVDVVPTIRNLVGFGGVGTTDGEDLAALVERPRASPVLAISDGFNFADRRAKGGRMPRTELSPMTVVGRLGNLRIKTVEPDWAPEISADEPTSLFGESVTGPDRAVAPSAGSAARTLTEAADSASRALRPSRSPLSRLTSWGY